MRRALTLKSEADALLKKYKEWVLLKKEGSSEKEVINVGDPVLYKKDQYNRQVIAVPEEARRYIFALWKRELALEYNKKVRELNQIGMLHGLTLLPIERPHP